MKVVRPPSFIPYGPLGCAHAKFQFEFEGPDLERVTQRFCDIVPVSANALPPGRYEPSRAQLAEDGYFILPVVDGEVCDELVNSLPVPPKFQPAPPSARGRRLEDFPYTVAGYYQHYTYEPFTNNSPGCDHDFGLESVEYVFKVEGSGELLPLEQVRREHAGNRDGRVYLTVKCTRCGDVHAIEQVSSSGDVDLSPPFGFVSTDI